MFDIRHDAAARLLHLRLSGHWDQAAAARFADALRRAVVRIGNQPFDVLSDARDFPPQSAAVAERFGAMAGASSARRCAIIVGSMLARIQAGRTMASDHVRIFREEDEARSWLESGGGAPPAQ